MLIQLPGKPWKNLLVAPAAGSGSALPVREHKEMSPGSPGCLCCLKPLSVGSASGFTPTASLCSWERGLCVSLSCLELSDSAELKPLARMWRSHLGDPAQGLVWPQPPKTGTGCTAPAPPRLLEGQSTGNKTLKSFSGSLDVFCVHDSTFSSKTSRIFSRWLKKLGVP